MKNILFLVLIIAISVYATTAFHELGHAFFAYVYGCKTNPFDIYISPYIIGSNDGKYIEGCWKNLGSSKQLVIASAGTIVNLVVGFALFLSINLTKTAKKNNLFFSFLLILSFLNFIEAFSYLIIGSFIHSSNLSFLDDMAIIESITGLNPWIFFIPSTTFFFIISYFYTQHLIRFLKIYFPNLKSQIKVSSKTLFIAFILMGIFLLLLISLSKFIL
jgi:hypothetical protein